MSGAVERLVQEVKHLADELIEHLPHGHGATHHRAADDVHKMAAEVDDAEKKAASSVPHDSRLQGSSHTGGPGAEHGNDPALQLAPTAADRSAAPVIVHESYAPKPLKPRDVYDDWRKFLGDGHVTNKHPRTGLPDADRLVSSDGTRSIRLGRHEMNSSPTKFHYHREEWSYDEMAGSWTVTNTVVRVPFPKEAW